MDRAEAFYRDVFGLRWIARFDPPGLLFFDLGNVRLLLEDGAPPSLLYLAGAGHRRGVGRAGGEGRRRSRPVPT